MNFVWSALDSSAMPLPGFVLGNNYWMGSIKGCEALQNTPTLTISNRFHQCMGGDLWSATAPFDIGYRMVYAEHQSPWQIQVEFFMEKNVWNFPIAFDSLIRNYLTQFYKFVRISLESASCGAVCAKIMFK